jgi:hypothetical protein
MLYLRRQWPHNQWRGNVKSHMLLRRSRIAVPQYGNDISSVNSIHSIALNQINIQDLEARGDGVLIHWLPFYIISVVVFLFETTFQAWNIPSSGKNPIQLGPIDRTSLCHRSSSFYLRTGTESSLRNIVLNKSKTRDNVKKINHCNKYV